MFFISALNFKHSPIKNCPSTLRKGAFTLGLSPFLNCVDSFLVLMTLLGFFRRMHMFMTVSDFPINKGIQGVR